MKRGESDEDNHLFAYGLISRFVSTKINYIKLLLLLFTVTVVGPVCCVTYGVILFFPRFVPFMLEATFRDKSVYCCRPFFNRTVYRDIFTPVFC